MECSGVAVGNSGGSKARSPCGSGTPVAANRKLLACSIVPKIRTEADAFRAMGNKYPSFVTINKEWSEHSIEGRPTYNEILYLLSSLLSQPTPASSLNFGPRCAAGTNVLWQLRHSPACVASPRPRFFAMRWPASDPSEA